MSTHQLPDTPVVGYTYTADDSAPETVYGPFRNLGRAALEWTLRLPEDALWDIEPLRDPVAPDVRDAFPETELERAVNDAFAASLLAEEDCE